MSNNIHSISFPVKDSISEVVQSIIYNEISLSQDGFIDLFPIGSSVLSFSLDNLPLYFRDNLVSGPYNLTGQLTQHFRMRAVEGQYRTVMFILKPYGAYRIFNTSQYPLQNNYFEIEILDQTFLEHSNKLSQVSDAESYFEIVSEWIECRLLKSFPDDIYLSVRNFFDETDFQNTKLKVEDLIAHYGSSKITFERHFKKITGLLPKQYISISRFNSAYFLINNNSSKSWLDVVSFLEYFDQSHFIKEFKKYCGFTPSQLHQSIFSIAGHVNEVNRSI